MKKVTPPDRKPAAPDFPTTDARGKNQVQVVVGKNYPHRKKVVIRLLTKKNDASAGYEAWFLDIQDHDLHSISDWEKALAETKITHQQLGDTRRPLLLNEGVEAIEIDISAQAHLVFLAHPWSGMISITCDNKTYDFDLYAPVGSSRTISLGGLGAIDTFDPAQRAWLKQIKKHKPSIISILNPDWRGVRSATENLVPHCLELRDNLHELAARQAARLLVETGCRKIIVGGFPLSYESLVRALKRHCPEIKICVFWLSSILQINESYVWHSFQSVIRLNKAGIVDTIGFAKKGMAQTMSTAGVKGRFIASYHRKIPTHAAPPVHSDISLGVWTLAPIWRKNPYAMIAACALIPGASLHMVAHDQESIELAKVLGVRQILHPYPIEQDKMADQLSQMHINLYVTLSECAPMLPLESLAVGVPCLFGPNAHFFEDNEYLHSRLVVQYPDRPEMIADLIRQALTERDEIIAEYSRWATNYNRYAQKTLIQVFEDRQ